MIDSLSLPLSLVFPNIISKEQKGFINGRNIKNCIALAFEAANMIHVKTFGNNIALNYIKITKSFDIIE